MSHANVPKFGNWDSEDNVPYTVYFEKARKNRGGKMINPNDPQENPDLFPNADPSPLPPASPPHPAGSRARPDKPNGRGAVGPTPEHGVSKEDSDFRQFSDSPARGENLGQRSANEGNYGGRGQRPARPARPSTGSEQSSDRSPLHPHYQARVMGKGSGSPAWEGKSHDGNHGAPGGSRLKPTNRGDESPGRGAAVPRFGEWDENDPQAAENFTHIFNQVREERNNDAGNLSGTPKHPSYGTAGRKPAQPKKSCCGWW